MTDDRIYDRLDETCRIIHEIKTDVALMKKDIRYIKDGHTQKKIDIRDRQKWYLGIVSFVFFGYIAIKELM